MRKKQPDEKRQDVGLVALNTHIEIEFISLSGTNERLEFDIVPDQQADFYSGLLGESTPLAQAILGRPEGSVAPYHVADISQVRIVSVKPIAGDASPEAAERRKKAAKDALQQVERTNALIFATTYEGKWGGYDADGMIKNWDS